jgi:hypothetical protein
MRTLLAPTEDFIKGERDVLSADVSAGNSAVLSVPNSVNFTVNDYIVVGTEGSNNAEIVQITAVAPTYITVDALILNHKADEPVVKYRYNQRKFYGCVTVTGTFAQIVSSGSPVHITVNNPQGTRIEYTGVEGYVYFYATYYNSTDQTETSPADAEVVYADESLRYCSLYAIRKQAGLTNNPYITDEIVEKYRRRAENEVDSFINARYVLPLINSIGVNEVPFMIENCTVLLAGGYMDWEEFGKDGDGVNWLKDARATLKRLQSPGGQQLLGSDQQEMQSKNLSNGIQSYPSGVDNNNGPIQLFTMRQKF